MRPTMPRCMEKSTWYPPAVFYYQMGWYDRDATQIFKVPPKEEAERLVALMGGRDKVVAAAKEALLDKKEYAWAAELVNYVYKLDPNDAEARQIKADALRKLGELVPLVQLAGRFCISEARALEKRREHSEARSAQPCSDRRRSDLRQLPPQLASIRKRQRTSIRSSPSPSATRQLACMCAGGWRSSCLNPTNICGSQT